MTFYMLFAESTGIDLESVYELIEHAETEGSGIAPELIAETRRELQRAQDMYASNPLLAAEVCKTAFLSARTLQFALQNRTAVKHKRNLSSRQSEPRQPKVQAWIEKQIKRLPDATAKELYSQAPTWVKDVVGDDRFAKRVTMARKSLVATK